VLPARIKPTPESMGKPYYERDELAAHCPLDSLASRVPDFSQLRFNAVQPIERAVKNEIHCA
jgi:hypothetical protein